MMRYPPSAARLSGGGGGLERGDTGGSGGKTYPMLAPGKAGTSARPHGPRRGKSIRAVPERGERELPSLRVVVSDWEGEGGCVVADEGPGWLRLYSAG